MDLCAYHHGVRIDFSRSGKPTDNASIETFNGTLRDECLNLHWFDTIAQASVLIEAWRRAIIMRAVLTWLSVTSRLRNMPRGQGLGTTSRG